MRITLPAIWSPLNKNQLSSGASFNPIALIASWPSTPPMIAHTGGTWMRQFSVISGLSSYFLFTESSPIAFDDSKMAEMEHISLFLPALGFTFKRMQWQQKVLSFQPFLQLRIRGTDRFAKRYIIACGLYLFPVRGVAKSSNNQVIRRLDAIYLQDVLVRLEIIEANAIHAKLRANDELDTFVTTNRRDATQLVLVIVIRNDDQIEWCEKVGRLLFCKVNFWFWNNKTHFVSKCAGDEFEGNARVELLNALLWSFGNRFEIDTICHQ